MDLPDIHVDDEYQDSTMNYSGLELNDEVGDGDNDALASGPRAELADPRAGDEDPAEAVDTQDVLTTRALARK